MIARSDGASSRGGFSTRSRTRIHAVAQRRAFVDRDDAVARDVFARHALDREHRPCTSFEHVDHLLDRRRIRVDHIVAEHDGERLVADQIARDEHGVAEAERLALPHVRQVDHVRDLANVLRAAPSCRALRETSRAPPTRRSDPRWRSCRVP